MLKYKVSIIESQLGWGQILIEVRHFDTIDLAEHFVEDFNEDAYYGIDKNYFIYARLDGLIE